MVWKTMLLKGLLTFAMSIAFGIVRQMSNKPIGFGIYTFVALGACGMAIAAVSLSPSNPLPLLSGSITSIGFLGTGALIKSGDRIYGFKSAASIWFFAILGILIGSGLYVMGFFVYVVIWVIFLLDFQMQRKGFGAYERRLQLKFKVEMGPDKLAEVGLMLKNSRQLVFDRDKNEFSASFPLHMSQEQIDDLQERLLKEEQVVSFTFE